MDDRPEALLPPLYAPWLREIVGGPIPGETVATCDRCVMLAPEGAAPGPAFFLAATKCCTFEPGLPNFLAGRILADADPSLDEGRRALEERIARRIGVTPVGVGASGAQRLLYDATPNVFGRAPALRCPYLTSGAGCGVWRHRPSVCATWYCKYVRGASGMAFWKLADRLLRAVEADLSLRCADELGIGATRLAALDADLPGGPDPSELGGPVDPALHAARWGPWEGRERDFYLAAARLVEPLRWADVAATCGPKVRVLAEAARDALRRLSSGAVPDRLRLGSIRLTQSGNGELRVASYSPYDPLSLPAPLAAALPAFDGRPTAEALERIRTEHGLSLGPGLVRKLVDFGILCSAD